MSKRFKTNLTAPESLGVSETVISPTIYQTTLTTTDNRTIDAGNANVEKVIRNRAGGNCQITFSPRLRGAATDISTIADGEEIHLLYQRREDDTDRWIAIGGDFTHS